MTTENIDSLKSLFKKSYEKIDKYRKDYDKLLWKQLRPDFRKWLINDSKKHPDMGTNEYYKENVNSMYNRFEPYFEPVK
jgi:hypothetical protein